MTHRIFIGRISSQARESDLKRFVKGFGKARDIILKTGFGFVDFDDKRDAEDAVYELNGREMCGQRVVVELAKGTDHTLARSSRRDRSRSRERYGRSDRREPGGRGKYGPPIRTEWEVKVKNLSSRVSWQDLKDHCRPYGEVTYADAHREAKNEAVVCFRNKTDMKNTIDKMDGMDINGKKIEMIPTRDISRSRSRSPRRSRSRSHSRSRSRSRRRSHSRSASRSRSRTPHSKSKSRSRSPSKSKSRSPSKSKSPSPRRSRSGSD